MVTLPVACFLVGDSIAQMLHPYLPCSFWVRVGEHTAVIARHVHPAPLVIISAGSNDDPGPVLLRNLKNVRAEAGFSKVVWILPFDPRRAALVTAVARAAGDRTVSFSLTNDKVHPKYPSRLAQDIANVNSKK